MKTFFRIAITLIACAAWLTGHAMEDVPDGLPDHIVGDVGIAVYTSNLHIGTEGMQSFALPYAFADYKRAFIRIDQVGIKTVKIGYGYLELVGKINLDNYKVKSPFNGNSINRSDPIPLGIGTFQETPIGGFFLNAYQDVGKSKGALYEFSYFAELETIKKIVLYPQLGIERQSSQYANYYYGISPGESILTGYNAYTAPATNNLIAGLMIEIPVIDNWYVNIYGKRKWMGSGINSSPVMNRSFQDNVLMAVAYRFK
ncbi:MipA/OmpV family protein [Polynucleobacter sp. MWH-Braz-FAM2G]|uniref:MipA/OmpV family protein n=1 Tax=Polynucleobacter sp. MWH-Braz-FAM2G TaxID=1855883 RepID=UPI001BFECDF3|nr:MipA/OmpV family protein [Polynucleobacter sp. MWH-Braz-FAM2G]QWD90740.1 MipA/OmpV family protein [Polynucleobacter sp. MWH-Braz-FAM2G]